jgi:signal transduction histidine kinase
MIESGHLIARKLTWMSLLACGTALVLACFVLMVYDFLDFRESMVRNRTIQAQIVGSNTVSSLVFNDDATAQQTLAALRAAPHIEGAGLYDADGRLFASYLRDPEGDALVVPGSPSDLTARYRFDGLSRMHLVYPVLFDATPIGMVYIRSDLNEITDRLTRFVFVSAIALLIAMAVAMLVSRVSRKSISEPIVELAAVATLVSADRDYSVRARTTGEGEVAVLISAFNEMLAQIQERDRSLQESYDLLEQRVQSRTAELNASNKELEAFCYSVSHDLRSPLRSIDGFSLALLEDHADLLDEDATGHLQRIRSATQRMGTLIDDLLNLSRITRTNLRAETVDLSGLGRAVATDLAAAQPDRRVDISIEDGMVASADSHLVRQVLENLIGNAWKFTSKQPSARIEVGSVDRGGGPIYFVRDNGAGFDPAYADRLFGVFQRLHAMAEFPGTGVGLAIVDRIVQRHGGRVWADGAVGRGATFYFTLSESPAASRATT